MGGGQRGCPASILPWAAPTTKDYFADGAEAKNPCSSIKNETYRGKIDSKDPTEGSRPCLEETVAWF